MLCLLGKTGDKLSMSLALLRNLTVRATPNKIQWEKAGVRHGALLRETSATWPRGTELGKAALQTLASISYLNQRELQSKEQEVSFHGGGAKPRTTLLSLQDNLPLPHSDWTLQWMPESPYELHVCPCAHTCVTERCTPSGAPENDMVKDLTLQNDSQMATGKAGLQVR